MSQRTVRPLTTIGAVGLLAVAALLLAALPALAHPHPDSFAPVDAVQPPTAENVRLVTSVPGSTGGHSYAYADRLYVGAYGAGLRIFDISTPGQPEQIGEYFPGPQGPGDAGARADAVPVATIMDGRHIAVLNGTNRVPGTQQSEFLDATDPENPELLWRFTGAADGEAHNGDIAHTRRLWLPSGGNGEHGLRIYDLEPLLDGEEPINLFRENPATMWDESPHRGDKPVGGGFTHTHDLEIYEDHPVQTGVDGDGQPIVEPRDIVLLAEGGNYIGAGNTGSIFVIDITDPQNPEVLNRWRQELDDPDGHPIRYYHEVQFLDADPSVMIVSDEDLHNGCEAGGLYAVQVTPDLREASKLSEWFNGAGTPAPVCSAHVFSSQGPLVFMGSYNAGLQVIDYSDPTNPVRAGQYIAPGANSWGALHYEGYIYVGDFGARGLDVFEFMGDVVAEGTIAPNPATQYVPGLNETVCNESGAPAGPTVDALMVDLEEEVADGQHTLRATGSGPAPYNLKVYFYDASCSFMSGTSLNADDPDVSGKIPQLARYAAVTNAVGAPTHAFVQIFAPATATVALTPV